MLPVVIEAEARAELSEAIEWYLAVDLRAADRLEGNVALAMQRISKKPTLYRSMRNGLRACGLKGFPYKIIYRAESDYVRIVAFFHTRRDPSILRKRV